MADARQEIYDIPRALAETFEKGAAEYEALVRKTRWGDGPLFVVAGAASLVAWSAAYAFEGLLGWPVVVRHATAFAAYGAAVLRPHSVVLAVSGTAEDEVTLQAARAARSRGAIVLALAADADGALAQMADGVFLVRPGGEVGEAGAGVKVRVLLQAGLGFVALVAAQVLKRHHPQLDALREDLLNLPRHAEWVLAQMPDAVRSLASELRSARRIFVAGAGFYHPAALQGAQFLAGLGGLAARGFDAGEFRDAIPPALASDDLALFLSGSRCRLRKEIYELAARAKNAKIISVTDSNDRELADRSALAVLLPILTEMAGSALALTLLAGVASQAARAQGPGPAGA